ncbi:MAG: phytanoyl-CoA dioxygenase family protein [Nitrospina sp.]|nr:phytanoyl-CoA dioxygenase family protein [Nitrospina sp.]
MSGAGIWLFRSKGTQQLGKLSGRILPACSAPFLKKSTGKNWLPPLHRDRFIPLMEKFERPEWQGWSTKEGSHFVEPPGTVLSQLVAVRIHLEENTLENGPLEVIPKSNKGEETNGSRLSLTVSAGGAILLSPLLLHASSKVKEGDRTVLHFLFGPRHLPKPAQWRWAI